MIGLFVLPTHRFLLLSELLHLSLELLHAKLGLCMLRRLNLRLASGVHEDCELRLKLLDLRLLLLNIGRVRFPLVPQARILRCKLCNFCLIIRQLLTAYF